MRYQFRIAAAVALVLGVAACTSTPSGADSDSSAAVDAETVIVDVRTPAEYATGHLEGATLLDFDAGDVAAAIPDLDPDARYLVYCRSGNRAGQAVELMTAAGFDDVTNLGSVEQAAEATGLPVVQ